MRIFSVLLLTLWLALAFYTGVVIGKDGLNLFPYFFGAIEALDWQGQFNFDFLLMLFVSASWTLWRNRFRPVAWILALFAFFGGAGFLLPYLVYLSFRHEGDVKAIVTGED